MRLGIFGGTFDPVHIGHLILADEARNQLRLDHVLWVLTPHPPHKEIVRITFRDQRLRMLQFAIQGDPGFEISRVDIDREGPHYALDTMNQLRIFHPDAELIYLMGGDSLHDLRFWHRPAEFVGACNEIGVMRRPRVKTDLPSLDREIPGVGEKVRWIDTQGIDISSSEIRQRIVDGRPFRYYLPDSVYKLILELGLYVDHS